MKLTYFEIGFFPFAVPEKDSSFAGSVGAGTVYPVGLSLDEAQQIYWRAQNYALSASGNGTLGEVTQTLGASGNLPARNVIVGTNLFTELEGFSPTGPWDLVCGRGVRQLVPGTGTIVASGADGSGTNNAAVLNLRVYLFCPLVSAPDPMVKYSGLWWPAMGVVCSVTNTVEIDSGGEAAISFDCTTVTDADHTTEIGSFSFFGAGTVPVYCSALAPPSGTDPAETRTFSGSLTVANEWA